MSRPSDAFFEYERLMHELHVLMLHGKDEEQADGSDPGEAIREQMDVAAYGCTPEERDCVGALSAALDELVDGPIPNLPSAIEEYRTKRRALCPEGYRLD